MATFVASNLFGPEIHSLYRWRNRDRVTLEGSINHADMSKIVVIYSESIAKKCTFMLEAWIRMEGYSSNIKQTTTSLYLNKYNRGGGYFLIRG